MMNKIKVTAIKLENRKIRTTYKMLLLLSLLSDWNFSAKVS
jgi:hypothetical protein